MNSVTMIFNSIEETITDLSEGKMIILIDDDNRENEGDIVLSAEKITPEIVNFIITYCKGLICVPMLEEHLKKLNIPLMVDDDNNNECHHTRFAVSVDSRETTTGISAQDRAKTILDLSNPKSQSDDFRKPGHIFPLSCHREKLNGRKGHTEAAVELMLLAGLNPVAVICEIIKQDGSMARKKDLFTFAQKYNLKITSIELLSQYLKEKK